MRADGWNGQSVRAHVEHAVSVGAQAATDVAELRDELEDERDEMKDRLASAETAAAEARELAQHACNELAELRRSRSGGATAPSVAEAKATAATNAEDLAQGRDWCEFLDIVEDVAGAAAVALGEIDKLHIELSELKGRAVKAAASGETQAGNEMKRRLAEAEAATLPGLEMVKRASDALEALFEFLAALEAQAEGKPHE